MSPSHEEKRGLAGSGYVAIVVAFLALGYVVTHIAPQGEKLPLGLIVAALVALFSITGMYMLQPNEAAVLQLFGSYVGTDRKAGLRWTIPLFTRRRVSLRASTFMSEKLKVNDQRGNPVEIAAAVVWHVDDTAKALFDVDNYGLFVRIQSETALRHLASSHPYDTGEAENVRPEQTLRGGSDAIARVLANQLNEKLAAIGLAVDDAKLTHLAYAPEIANAMLRRQQAEAVIDARRKIVDGAVGMVEMALRQLAERNVVKLDDERKAAMVGNLLVVLCGEQEVTPVVNSGSVQS